MTTKIKLLHTAVENFASYERADYPLTDLGLLLMEGNNLDDPRTPSNGAGKSTVLLDGPTWCLHGATRGRTSAGGVINDLVKKNCAVTQQIVHPDLGPVTVQRFRKVKGKNGLRLWVGRHVKDLEDANDESHKPFEATTLDTGTTQARIDKILGMDLEVWRAAVYRSQDDETRFASRTDAEQKALLTRFYALDIIDEWKKAAEDRATEVEYQIRDLQEARAHIEAELAADRVGTLRAAQAQWETDRQARVVQLDAQFEEARGGWQAAEARLEAARKQAQEATQLRNNPPPMPQLEQEPAEPAPVQSQLPQEPPRPLQVQQPTWPLEPQQGSVSEPPKAQELSAQASEVEQRAHADQALSRLLTEQAEALAARAAKIQAQRSGQCGQCGSQLTPEHADAEASRIFAESQVKAHEADMQRVAAEQAQGLAAQLRDQAASSRQVAREEAAQHHAQAHEAWTQQCASLNQQWEAANALGLRSFPIHDQWEQECRAIQADDESRRRAAYEQWQAVLAAVRGRNQAKINEAHSGYNARLAALDAGSRDAQAEADRDHYIAAGHRHKAAAEAARAEVWSQAVALKDAEAATAASKKKLADIATKQEALEAEARVSAFWVQGLGSKGLKSFVLDEKIQELTDRTNDWLKILTGGVYWVRFETQRATARGRLTERFSLRVFRHLRAGGVAEREWDSWSGGQRGRIGLAVDWALADVVAARAKQSVDLLVLDEVFKHLDSGGRDAVLEALKVLRRDRGSIAVVDHDPQFRAAFEHRWTAVLENGVSRLERGA